LVVGELELVLRPVVLVRPLELLERLLDRLGNGLGIVQMALQLHQDFRHEGRHVVWIGLHHGAQAQDARVEVGHGPAVGGQHPVQVLALARRLGVGPLPLFLGRLRLSQRLRDHFGVDFVAELLQQDGLVLVVEELRVDHSAEDLGRLLLDVGVLVAEQVDGDVLGPLDQLRMQAQRHEVGEDKDLEELQDGELGLPRRGLGDFPDHVEDVGDGAAVDVADAEEAEGLEAGLADLLVRLGADELAEEGEELVELGGDGGRGRLDVLRQPDSHRLQHVGRGAPLVWRTASGTGTGRRHVRRCGGNSVS